MSNFGSSTGALFGGGNNSTQSASSNTTTSQLSLFGSKPVVSGGLFGGAQNTSGTGDVGSNKGSSLGGALTSNAAAPPSSTNFFGSTNTTSAGTAPSSLFGSTGVSTIGAGTTPANSLFGSSFLSKPTDQNVTNTSKPAGTNLFGQTNTPAGTTTAVAGPAASGGLFGQPAKPTESTSGVAASSSSPFAGGFFGKTTTSGSGTSTTPAATPAGPLSIPAVKPAEKKDGISPSPTPTPAFNLFGPKPAEEKKDTGATTSAPATSFSLGLTKPAENTSSNAQAALTTAAVAVAPPSMLRGKTIEEIVNKWTAELETHVREFNKFASEVAVWDRALIENGNNLSALYSHVQIAERDQSDIDQSLDHIEQQQKELVSTLDAYEKLTQEIIGGQGGGLRALDTGPADTERDKNYMLATDLHTHLDDLSGSLTQMIESVNAISLTPNDSTPAPEDPMSQIAQILSSHLESLQWIDGAVREVEAKVTEVERRTKDSEYSGAPAASQKKQAFRA